MKEVLWFLALFILLVAGWLLSASLAFRLHFANDTIRMLRANALAITPEERQAVEWCVEMAVLHATDCDDEIATLRGLLERTAQNGRAR